MRQCTGRWPSVTCSWRCSPFTDNLENFPLAERIIAQARPADELKIFVRSTLHMDLKASQQFQRICKACVLWFSGQLHINHEGLLALAHPFFAQPLRNRADKPLNLEHSGWYALEDQLVDTGAPHLERRRRKLLKKIAQGTGKVTVNLKKRASTSVNPVAIRRLQNMIRRAEAKGIHCFIVTLPPSFNALPDSILEDPKWRKHFIQLASPEIWPEFYEARALFDGGHLNNWGSQRMTEVLAAEALNRLQAAGAQ